MTRSIITMTLKGIFETAKRIAGFEAAATYGASKLSPGKKTLYGNIYLGQYTPKDRNGNSLSKTFNVFAAPEDIMPRWKKRTYLETVKLIAGLKKWHGYDGTNYANDTEIYAALEDGSYNGGWIIPTRDILRGYDVDGNPSMPGNIFAHKDGAFFGQFEHAFGHDAQWHLSSTECRHNRSQVHIFSLPCRSDNRTHKDDDRFSCRPVRLVEIPRKAP